MTEPVRILIVDDQESYRSAVRMVVSLADGFEVVGEANSGELGVEMAFGLRPDLVLMDINMPGMDGLEATRIITEKHGPMVLMLSTYEAGEYAKRATGVGAIGFLTKSDFNPVALAAAWEERGSAPARSL